MTPLVYIAGPYSSDPVAHTRTAILAGMGLWRNHRIPVVVPHTTLFMDLLVPSPVQSWYDLDLAVLARCDAVLRIPGTSTGADQETDEARRLGIPVFTDPADLVEWATTGAHL